MRVPTVNTQRKQLQYIHKGVDLDCTVCEDDLDVVSLQYRTLEQDIFDCVIKTIPKFELPWTNLVCIATNGAPPTTG